MHTLITKDISHYHSKTNFKLHLLFVGVKKLTSGMIQIINWFIQYSYDNQIMLCGVFNLVNFIV